MRKVLALVTALLVVVSGCTGESGQVSKPAVPGAAVRHSPALPEGFWFEAGFPSPGSRGLAASDDVRQRWLGPCLDSLMPADTRRTAAYSLQAAEWEPYLVDTRQLVLYQDEAGAVAAVRQLVSRVRSCSAKGTRILKVMPVANLGDRSVAVRATVLADRSGARSGPRVWIGTLLLMTRRGRAVVSTGLPFETFQGLFPNLPAKHLRVVEQLCVFEPDQPCALPVTRGRGSLEPAWLPKAAELGITPAPVAGPVVEGGAAGRPTMCGQESLAALGATSAIRRDYGPDGEDPSVTVVLSQFHDQLAARKANARLNAWLGDCSVGLELAGRLSYAAEWCSVRVVKVSAGEARTCRSPYATRGAGMHDTTLRAGVLRVGRQIAVVELMSGVDQGVLPDVLELIARRMGTSEPHQPTYDGSDIAVPPVRLGMSMTQLRPLSQPLRHPKPLDGCVEVLLRTGATAIVDAASRRVVGYQLGGDDYELVTGATTPRGLGAHSPVTDALAAYPEGVRRNSEGPDDVVDEMRAALADGSTVEAVSRSSRGGPDQWVRVYLEREPCGSRP